MDPRRAALLLFALAGGSACDRAERSLRAAAVRALDAGAALLARPSPADAGPPPDEAPAATDGAPSAAVDAGSPSIDEVTLDELRLIAVVSVRGAPAAMVTLPSGHGVTLRRGMYVGRPERVRLSLDAGALTPVVRWRVARITPSRLRREPDGRLAEAPADVVFERTDPAADDAVEERSLALSPGAGGGGEVTIRMAGGGRDAAAR
jgi:hypothetical protein